MTVRIQLGAPIWDGHKNPKFGIAEYRMVAEQLEVEVLYRSKGTGGKPFPHIYRISRTKALTYPVQVRCGVRLRIIPVKDFDVYYQEVPCGGI